MGHTGQTRNIIIAGTAGLLNLIALPRFPCLQLGNDRRWC